MKIHNLSKVGYLLALFVIITSTIRYQFIFTDYYRFFLMFSMGLVIALASYIYSYMRNNDKDKDDMKNEWKERFERLERQTDNIGAKAYGLEWEAKKEEGLGAERNNLTGIPEDWKK